jgi:HSP20 family protein
MSLIRWEPFSGIDEALLRIPSLYGKRALEWSPSVDISETDGEYLIRADLPSIRKEDVHVTVDERLLTISGERRQKSEEKKERMHRVETVYGKFSRSFTLPENADLTNIRADSKDGVVTVHVAKVKAEARKPTEIKVQ